MLGNTNGLGKKRPAKAVRATAAALRGIPRSESVRRKISKNRKGKLLGQEHPNWKGGKTIERGYILIKMRGHRLANPNGYVREHRLIAEKTLGRPLRKDEDVHHKNGRKTDNRPENLEVLTKKQHSKFTYKLRKINRRGQLC